MGSKNKKKEKIFVESDEVFAFIVGYTSGGIPYGVTWEEVNREAVIEIDENEELPFT